MPTVNATQERRSTIAQKVKWSREQAGWTQAQAASAMGVARGTFNAWETGRAVIPPAKLHKLKHLAHVNFSEFKPELIYDDDGFPYPLSLKEYEATLEDDEARDILDAKLVAMEGAAYAERECVRYVNNMTKLWNQLESPKSKASLRKEFFTTQGPYLNKLAIDNGW